MKTLLSFFILCVAHTTFASVFRMTAVTQPLYLHGSDEDPRISFESVPYVTHGSDPEWRFSAIGAPFVPPGAWEQRHDVNLASLYHISLDGTYKKNGKDILVTIDASKAAQPEGYPFTVEQVIDAVVTCAKLMYPPRPSDEGALIFEITRPTGKSEVIK